jgi:hypothetical protein
MKREMLDLVRDRRSQNERVQLDFNTLMERRNASEEGRLDLENKVKDLDANLQSQAVTIAVAVKNTKVVSDKVGAMELDRKVMEGKLTKVTKELEASKAKIESLTTTLKDNNKKFRYSMLDEVAKRCSEDEDP